MVLYGNYFIQNMMRVIYRPSLNDLNGRNGIESSVFTYQKAIAMQIYLNNIEQKQHCSIEKAALYAISHVLVVWSEFPFKANEQRSFFRVQNLYLQFVSYKFQTTKCSLNKSIILKKQKKSLKIGKHLKIIKSIDFLFAREELNYN